MRLEAAHDKMGEENKERDKRIDELEMLHIKLKQREEELYNMIKETRSKVEADYIHYQAKIDRKVMDIDKAVQLLPSKISQGVSDMEQMHYSMKKTIKDTFQDFSNQLKVDTARLQELETDIRPLPGALKKLRALDAEMATIKVNDMDIYWIKHFIERDLPVLTHMQMCEGLSQVSGRFLPELREFEMKKLKELNAYSANARGAPCNTGDFIKRIQAYAQFLEHKGQGVIPFEFGEDNDYWPGMGALVDEPFKLSVEKEVWL